MATVSTERPPLILFDCDGTLVDSHAAIIHAMQHAFREEGLAEPPKALISSIIGLSLAEAVAVLKPPAQKQVGVIEAFRTHYLANEHSLSLYPDVENTLRVLHERGYWLGIVTGKSRAGLTRVLESFGLADLFYVLRTADCCPSKPHPAMVTECMREMGVDAGQTWVVGDAVVDMQMALAADAVALGVSFGAPMHDSLKQAGACAVVDEFAALLAHFPPLPDIKSGLTLPQS